MIVYVKTSYSYNYYYCIYILSLWRPFVIVIMSIHMEHTCIYIHVCKKYYFIKSVQVGVPYYYTCGGRPGNKGSLIIHMNNYVQCTHNYIHDIVHNRNK